MHYNRNSNFWKELSHFRVRSLEIYMVNHFIFNCERQLLWKEEWRRECRQRGRIDVTPIYVL